MRRQKTVGHGQCCHHWHANIQQRQTGRGHHRKYQRQQQNKADFEEHRQTDHQTGDHQRPLHAFFTERANQRGGDALSRAGIGNQLTEHRAEPEDHRQPAERPADPILY